MDRIRICQLITELAPAGAERAVYELATRLDKRRFEVSVIGLIGGQVADWLARAGVRVDVLGLRGKWDLPRLLGLHSLLRRRRADILHTHLFHADVAGRLAAALAGVPHVVHTVHTAEGRFRPWQFAWARCFAGRNDRLICVSPSVREFHARKAGLPKGRYTVIPNGVDVAAFARDDARRRQLRAEWGLKDDDVLAACVGRLEYEKGTDLLPAALSRLAARGRTIHCVVAGDGPMRGLIEDYCSAGSQSQGGTAGSSSRVASNVAQTRLDEPAVPPDKSRCRYLGYVADVRGVLSAADMFLMPSRWEGWPLALAEAMAAGLPVVAANVPGIRDMVVAGRTALLFARGDAAALAETVERLARDAELRATLAAAAQKRATESYGIDRFLAAYEKVYEEVTRQ